MGHERRVLAAAAAAVLGSLVVAIIDIVVAVSYPVPAAEAVDAWLPVGIVARLAPVVVGALLVVSRPRNVMAWVLLMSGIAITAMQAVRIAATAVLASDVAVPEWVRAIAPLAAMTPQLWFGLAYGWPAAVVVLFPGGRSGTWRARRTMVLLAAATVGMAVTAAVGWPVTSAPFAGERNVWFVPALEDAAAVGFALAWLGFVVTLVAVALDTVRRTQRATGELRLVLQWLLVAAVLPPLSTVACLAALFGPVPMQSVDLAVAAPQLLVVGAVVVAVTRHGLAGIDRLLNRALVYAVLTPVLLSVFVVVTAGAGWVVGGTSRLATAAATAAAAAAFLPVRARVQRVVDRWSSPRRAAAAEQLRDFTRRVHVGQASPTDVVATLARVLGDPDLRVRFRIGDEWRGIDGETVGSDPDPTRRLSPVRFAGTVVAVVEYSDELTYEPELLRAVLDEVAATLAVVRLQLDVGHQLHEVEESRRRIVTAGVTERRRLERDLHDGAQQRLVALGIFLRRLQTALPRDAARVSTGLDAAVGEVSAAIGELRTLAAGVRPARLDEGLRAALDDLAGSSPISVTVQVPGRRLAHDIEAAAYFITCEAVTNAIKHADPTVVLVDGLVEAGMLRLAVQDDGRGGAAPRPEGGGLAGMADRARTVGGSLTVTSPVGMGTRVDLVLPCG